MSNTMITSTNTTFQQRLVDLLHESRGVKSPDLPANDHLLEHLDRVSQEIRSSHPREADALQDALLRCTTKSDFGGLGLASDGTLQPTEEAEALFFASAYLEALNYQDRRAADVPALDQRPAGRRGMTLAEKIFAAHDVAGKGEVRPGDVIRLDVDWVIASELSWAGMEKTYNSLGKPGIFRNDRLWIAGDHVVDPRMVNHPRIKPLIESAERAKDMFKLTEYQGMNYTIMHTEFCRERAQPGMLVIGSDSHTCSAGSVSCLAIGLGVADVTLPTVTGQTWIKVPETVEIRFINKPRPGLGGKDIILYILKELKRNTVAAERVVEYTGPGLKYLSCDARFAFCNMTTEFGGVSGICVPDETTEDFVNLRKHPKHKRDALYYRPDEDAQYAESYIIDLENVEPFVARYPSPDDVVPVHEVAGTKLDGCFIGACTTAREDLILAALVLEAGLNTGMVPVPHGKRKVVPGSRPILHELKVNGLVDFYEQAGFEVGVPGCSYCVGMSADKAGKGEVWLSSQNRNFENRMGPGAIGSVTSAVTVAASSFNMSITDPAALLDAIDMGRLQSLLGATGKAESHIQFVEPAGRAMGSKPNNGQDTQVQDASNGSVASLDQINDQSVDSTTLPIKGKIQTLGDFIDTDALAPAEALVTGFTAEQTGQYCLVHTHPDFRRRVKEDGMNIVVAGKAFGVGSSRENAVTALQGAGVQCVIARSFAFIYARNQPNLGLLGIVMDDEDFYTRAKDGVEIVIDVDERTIKLKDKTFNFSLSELEVKLWLQGGISKAFRKWGKTLLEEMTAPANEATKFGSSNVAASTTGTLEW